MPERRTILTFVHYYLPGYKSGGPIRTIANLVDALGDEFDFRIVTADRDATDTQPYANLPGTASWIPVGKAQVLYLSPAARGFAQIRRLLRDTPHDLLYLNSLFDPDFTLKPLLARRLSPVRASCIVAPRGEFSAGALRLKSAKKRVFLAAARAGGLYRGIAWHASSEHEAADILRTYGDANPIRIASNLQSGTPAEADAIPLAAPGRPLRLCFLSRISPMKNLDYALRVLRQLRVPASLDIHGPIRDDTYWKSCQALMADMPAGTTVRYRGSLEHAQVAAMLARYDLFFLPTRGENYGHVIAEALAAGTPVLIADTTPWRGLAELGVGWDLPLADMAGFRRTIERLAAMPADEFTRLRRRAAEFAHARLADPQALAANRNLFLQAQT